MVRLSIVLAEAHFLMQLNLRFDELHPSEQADRVVAREITNAITRRSEKWAMWFS